MLHFLSATALLRASVNVAGTVDQKALLTKVGHYFHLQGLYLDLGNLIISSDSHSITDL